LPIINPSRRFENDLKKRLLDLIICPNCLPGENPLTADIGLEYDADIEIGTLHCPQCAAQFPIVNGVALLDPFAADSPQTSNKYETDEVVSSYLWSQYGELIADEHSSQAYSTWAGCSLRPASLWTPAELWDGSPLR
jgi:uncharacterized protein YbaR (Trm112 family)